MTTIRFLPKFVRSFSVTSPRSDPIRTRSAFTSGTSRSAGSEPTSTSADATRSRARLVSPASPSPPMPTMWIFGGSALMGQSHSHPLTHTLTPTIKMDCIATPPHQPCNAFFASCSVSRCAGGFFCIALHPCNPVPGVSRPSHALLWVGFDRSKGLFVPLDSRLKGRKQPLGGGKSHHHPVRDAGRFGRRSDYACGGNAEVGQQFYKRPRCTYDT